MPIAQSLIEKVKSGGLYYPEEESVMKEQMQQCFAKLKEKGADAIILGCTEFPVIYDKFTDIEKHDLPVISSTEALAEAGVEKFSEAYKQRLIERYSGVAQSSNIATNQKVELVH